MFNHHLCRLCRHVYYGPAWTSLLALAADGLRVQWACVYDRPRAAHSSSLALLLPCGTPPPYLAHAPVPRLYVCAIPRQPRSPASAGPMAPPYFTLVLLWWHAAPTPLHLAPAPYGAMITHVHYAALREGAGLHEMGDTVCDLCALAAGCSTGRSGTSTACPNGTITCADLDLGVYTSILHCLVNHVPLCCTSAAPLCVHAPPPSPSSRPRPSPSTVSAPAAASTPRTPEVNLLPAAPPSPRDPVCLLRHARHVLARTRGPHPF
ncbi:hypothetical protein DFH07DRAFT_958828 [Mycena maculata]|uniref:Uncharacterized protein n=1 Tax=Mycena maculata TaxID=230809 RepID=A0AAD7J5A1_9AGAR|nr:hypothetical protein DFH07DRAFT_958828 [Mycena maculata]